MLIKKHYILFIKHKTLLITNQNNEKFNHISKNNKKTEINIINNNSKLYNSTESPYLSIILDNERQVSNYDKLLHLISIILNETYIDIQIIILENSSSMINKSIISNYSITDKRTEIFIQHKRNLKKKFFNIMNNIKGKYLIYLYEHFEFKNKDFFNIYNKTKGSRNNIFEYLTLNNNTINIIRTKILKDIIDSEIKLNNFQELINYIYDYPLPDFNYIPVSFCSNNKYTTLTYTSMLSILNSKSYYTYIMFFIVIPKDFNKHNYLLLNSLYEQYNFFNISFIKMDDRYNKAFTARYLTTQAYYRYSLGELIPNINKIIYLDSDTICFTDLSEFYNLNFGGKIILGRLMRYYKSTNNKYFTINTGILLLNLEKMRKIKLEKQIINILNNGFGYNKTLSKIHHDPGTDILTLDQALINIYFYKITGFFPPKYNVYNKKIDNIAKYYRDSQGLYSKEYFYFSHKFPVIKHFLGTKNLITKNEDWNYFARNSKYFISLSNKLKNIYNYSQINFL